MSMSVLVVFILSLVVALALAQTAPALGTAGNYAVLAGSTVTNTGASSIVGEVGVSPGSAITGFPPGQIGGGGTAHSNDGVTQQAQIDLINAYNDLAAQTSTLDLTGQNLGGMTLTPGVYTFTTTAQLTGTLTLDAQGDPNAVFVFQIGSTLTTASSSAVLLINGGSSANVFWQVGSSATLGTGSQFAGDILALTSITVTTGASVSGRLLARNGAVTLDTNSVAFVISGVTNDPHFHGLRGQSFLINGVSGSVYNLISTPNLQVNSRFTHIDSKLLDADSTWITEWAVMLRTPANESAPVQRVYVGVNPVTGAFEMMLNNEPVKQASLMPVESASVRAALVVLQERVASANLVKWVRTSQFDLVVMNSEFVLELNVDPVGHPQWCSDGCPHLDMNAYPAVDLQLLSSVDAHGLFGQTWRARPEHPGQVPAIEGEPHQYVVRDGLWGTQFDFNRFKAAA